MPSRQESVSFAVSADEKQAIEQAAAADGESLSSFARKRVLNGLSMAAAEDSYDGRMSPLEDFKTARLTVDETAAPVAKSEVYDSYVSFCQSAYPDHEIETQHKVSREIGAMPGVETGRAYISTQGANPSQSRSYKNLNLTTRD